MTQEASPKPPAPTVTPRFDVKDKVDCSVPPQKVTPPDVLPSLASELMESVPALIVVPPV